MCQTISRRDVLPIRQRSHTHFHRLIVQSASIVIKPLLSVRTER
jgi:hypothetical protein